MWQRIKPYIFVLPAFLVASTLILGGLIEGVLGSLGVSYLQDSEAISFRFYRELLHSKDFWKSSFLTLKISIISTVIAAILGLIIIFILFLMRIKKKNHATGLWRIFQIPMLFSYLIGAYAIFLLLSQSGWISSICYRLGIIKSMNAFPILVNDERSIGIITAYVWKTTPFMVLMLYPVLLKVENNWWYVASTLGANRFNFFKEVVLPMLKSPLTSAAFIVFSFSFSAFEVPYLLGVSYPKALGVYSYEMYVNGNFSNRPLALATNIIIFLFIIFIAILYYFLRNKEENNFKM
ncbi:ABC transporter permease [Haloimpatiens lingqiaonensis]|uniref:ABC transporter permease n=1 Tax=Haloimpatiens lingqiaonensis TaxID=1380675 RepID=UPI0010FEA53C|nr:ABC transporter permease subunit [Haloimpatiens lingqiaonensis]